MDKVITSTESYKCKKCGKIFKKYSILNNHVSKQVCYNLKEKTYCSICNCTFDTAKELSKHLISKEHFDMINNDDIDPISNITNLLDETKIKKLDKLDKSIDIDPYLSKKDKKDIKLNGIGTTIDINFNNGGECRLKIDSDCENDRGGNSDEHNCTSGKVIDVEPSPLPPKLNDASKKILKFIISISLQDNSINKFYNLINKLTSEHLQGIPVEIISCDDISLDIRQKYVQVMRKYREILKKKHIDKTISKDEVLKYKMLNI